ncbi:uncharacterized protein BDW43DRAFT_323019 [Aspergillus alliaceus]|uniref:uncharacterized protein n=1 Tax=Petromyces alliaceus TaxID=209559 RepID=UPI0012A46425|nr:uncharacterized protein BDW43DRAFT_323019 [Aspergillus alliaceus]KAB8228296.1 hypothetical protein BDW43DRAFT_323019 [Aspergillus alliaceus]
MAESLLPGDFKSYSCLTCRQRKVKCDRRTPCSNCVKAEKQCSFIPPVRGKRKRTKPPREGLHAKLKRYEELLRSYGVKVEPSDDYYNSESETADAEPMDESTVHESELFFQPEENYKFENLASLHPSLQVLPKSKEIYRLQHPQDLSKSLEVVMFAFYLATINTLKEYECRNIFGLPQPVMHSRYRLATRQALVNAGFLSTSSPMTLRAYAMFMMCVRNSYQCDTVFVLLGVAIRLARKMGLHREGTSLGLSPFETEMRRRLWWHLVHVDFRTTEVLGTRPSLDLSSGDAKMPLNVDDEDLHSDMVDLLPALNDITSIALCLIKCEILETLRKFATVCPGDVRWEILLSPDVSLAKKDSMNLFAHNPRQFANSPVKVPQSERSIVFSNASKLLEYPTLMQGGGNGLQKYVWQTGTSYLWNTVLYMLIEARHRKTGPEVDQVWQLIRVAFSHYPQNFEKTTGAVYSALGKWTLEVWDDYVAASKAEGLPEPPPLEYINAIRRCRRPATSSPSSTKDRAADSGPATRYSSSYNRVQPRYEGSLSDFGPFESYDFPSLMPFETDPNEWIQWAQLLGEQGSLAQILQCVSPQKLYGHYVLKV